MPTCSCASVIPNASRSCASCARRRAAAAAAASAARRSASAARRRAASAARAARASAAAPSARIFLYTSRLAIASRICGRGRGGVRDGGHGVCVL